MIDLLKASAARGDAVGAGRRTGRTGIPKAIKSARPSRSHRAALSAWKPPAKIRVPLYFFYFFRMSVTMLSACGSDSLPFCISSSAGLTTCRYAKPYSLRLSAT